MFTNVDAETLKQQMKQGGSMPMGEERPKPQSLPGRGKKTKKE
jgi:hypothetical protein